MVSMMRVLLWELRMKMYPPAELQSGKQKQARRGASPVRCSTFWKQEGFFCETNPSRHK